MKSISDNGKPGVSLEFGGSSLPQPALHSRFFVLKKSYKIVTIFKLKLICDFLLTLGLFSGRIDCKNEDVYLESNRLSPY